jgi:hypothetical protein
MTVMTPANLVTTFDRVRDSIDRCPATGVPFDYIALAVKTRRFPSEPERVR